MKSCECWLEKNLQICQDLNLLYYGFTIFCQSCWIAGHVSVGRTDIPVWLRTGPRDVDDDAVRIRGGQVAQRLRVHHVHEALRPAVHRHRAPPRARHQQRPFRHQQRRHLHMGPHAEEERSPQRPESQAASNP